MLAGVAVMVRDKYATAVGAGTTGRTPASDSGAGKRPARVPPGPGFSSRATTVGQRPKWLPALDVALGTVYRVKQRFTEEGLAGVLKDRPQANRRRKLDDRGEAHLIALACSPPPAGHDHWTLRLLAGKVVELKLASSMSHEGVRKRLKKRSHALMVHSQGERGVRGQHGGPAGPLRRTL